MLPAAPHVVIMMGVMSAGKTHVGQELASYIDYDFFECDTAHSRSNKEKMRQGIPLTDEDRLPWLEVLADNIKTWQKSGQDVVMTCPSHKKAYRDILRVAPVQFVYLKTTREILEERAKTRDHEYMSPKLLESQLAIMEEPDGENDVMIITNDKPEDVMVKDILCELARKYQLVCDIVQV